MRISDWSSDVCSSDLAGVGEADGLGLHQQGMRFARDDTGDDGAGEGLDRGQYCELARARPVDPAQPHRKTDFQANAPAKKATLSRPADIPDDDPPPPCTHHLAESVAIYQHGKGTAEQAETTSL